MLVYHRLARLLDVYRSVWISFPRLAMLSYRVSEIRSTPHTLATAPFASSSAFNTEQSQLRQLFSTYARQLTTHLPVYTPPDAAWPSQRSVKPMSEDVHLDVLWQALVHSEALERHASDDWRLRQYSRVQNQRLMLFGLSDIMRRPESRCDDPTASSPASNWDMNSCHQMYPHALEEGLLSVQRYVRWTGLACTPPTPTPMGIARHDLVPYQEHKPSRSG